MKVPFDIGYSLLDILRFAFVIPANDLWGKQPGSLCKRRRITPPSIFVRFGGMVFGFGFKPVLPQKRRKPWP
jgi:hypothetical protein